MKAGSWDSALYEERHGYVARLGLDLVALLAPQAGERILDLGCGTGHLTQRIAERGACVTGLDRDGEMLRQARANYPKLCFVAGDGQDFTVAEAYDAIFSNAALHWMKDAAGAAGCMARALRPGGRLVAELGGAGNIQTIYGAWCAALKEAGLAVPAESPWYFPTAEEYAATLEGCGLEVLQAFCFARPTTMEGEAGLRNWLRMFLGENLARLRKDEREVALRSTERRLRPRLWQGEHWLADYVRLRVVARRREAG